MVKWIVQASKVQFSIHSYCSVVDYSWYIIWFDHHDCGSFYLLAWLWILRVQKESCTWQSSREKRTWNALFCVLIYLNRYFALIVSVYLFFIFLFKHTRTKQETSSIWLIKHTSCTCLYNEIKKLQPHLLWRFSFLTKL